MAKKDIPSIVSAAGSMAAFTTDLMREVRELGGTDDQLHRAFTDQTLIKRYADIVVDHTATHAHLTQYASGTHSVNLGDLIDACRFTFVDSRIGTLHFKVPNFKTIDRDLWIVHLRRRLNGVEARRELDRLGYVPADVVSLLMLAEIDGKLGMEFAIAALGTSWGGYVPVIVRHAGAPEIRRQLRLTDDGNPHKTDTRWRENTRFLAVRK